MEAQTKKAEMQRRRRPYPDVVGVIWILIAALFFFMGLARVCGSLVDALAGTDIEGSESQGLLWGLILFLPAGSFLAYRLRNWLIFRLSPATAQATVVDRQVKVERDEYGREYSVYMVTIHFPATRTDGSIQQMTLQAQVSKRVFEKLGGTGSTVQVRYAPNDPRVLMFEGE